MNKMYSIIINKKKATIDHDTFLRLINKYKQDKTVQMKYIYAEAQRIVSYVFTKDNNKIVLIMKGAK